MVDIDYSSTAFLALETLQQDIAFGIVRLIDYLGTHPEMGRFVQIRFAPDRRYPMLIYRGTHRVIYEFDASEDRIYIGYVQDCRQKLPSARDLKRDMEPEGELPLE